MRVKVGITAAQRDLVVGVSSRGQHTHILVPQGIAEKKIIHQPTEHNGLLDVFLPKIRAIRLCKTEDVP